MMVSIPRLSEKNLDVCVALLSGDERMVSISVAKLVDASSAACDIPTPLKSHWSAGV
jgi:hypothetical protein